MRDYILEEQSLKDMLERPRLDCQKKTQRLFKDQLKASLALFGLEL